MNARAAQLLHLGIPKEQQQAESRLLQINCETTANGNTICVIEREKTKLVCAHTQL